jgi:hypothetical protein
MNNAKKVLVLCLATSVLGALAGCSRQHRSLLVTEIGTTEFELYLNEEPSRRLTLGNGLVLSLTSATGAPPAPTVTSSIDLGAFGADMVGGSFLVIWQDGNYQGPPVAAEYIGGQAGRVPGIKVGQNTLNAVRMNPGEVRLSGSQNRFDGLLAIIPLWATDTIDDVVRYGRPKTDRPATGGAFTDASMEILGNPLGAIHLQRKWDPATAMVIDTDHEDDWEFVGQSIGAATP